MSKPPKGCDLLPGKDRIGPTNMELLEVFTKNLGVQEEQARGGVGLLLRIAKQRLEEADFSKVAHSIPGFDEMLRAAPEDSGVVSAFSGLGSVIAAGIPSAANLACLAGGFAKLGMDTRTIGEFVSLLLGYLRTRGGEVTKGLVEKALTQDGSAEGQAAENT